MKLNVAICDDNQIDLDEESKVIQEVLRLKKIPYRIRKYDNSKDLLESGEKYDIVFLDVEMAGTDGLGIAKHINDINRRCLIFFVTNYESYMDSAMDEYAFRFWIKPLNKKRLMTGIDSAIKRIENYNRVITVNVDRLDTNIFVRDIIYICAENKKTRIVTTNGQYITGEPFKKVKSMIDSYSFAEPHSSYYVNMKFIKEYSHTAAICAHEGVEYEVYISRRKYVDFNKRFIDWVGEQV